MLAFSLELTEVDPPFFCPSDNNFGGLICHVPKDFFSVTLPNKTEKKRPPKIGYHTLTTLIKTWRIISYVHHYTQTQCMYTKLNSVPAPVMNFLRMVELGPRCGTPCSGPCSSLLGVFGYRAEMRCWSICPSSVWDCPLYPALLQ